MKIAVLSGKGGTGKTFVSVNLAYLIKNASYYDCDVEEPNGQVYFKGEYKEESVSVDIPVIDHDKCILCGKCSEFCKFNALAIILDKVRLFPQLCHSCGGCKIVCPVGAITETKKVIGKIKETEYEGHHIVMGVLNIKEETGVKIIGELVEKTKDEVSDVLIDCPPGNGCSVMESIRDVDYCILVAEPTVFGLHNLKMVYELTQVFNKKVGLVINKASDSDIIDNYAKENSINVLSRIPFDKEMGYLNSLGEIVVKNPKFKGYFEDIISKIFGDKL
jgi:MinD superfamily P-loop ATPase